MKATLSAALCPLQAYVDRAASQAPALCTKGLCAQVRGRWVPLLDMFCEVEFGECVRGGGPHECTEIEFCVARPDVRAPLPI